MSKNFAKKYYKVGINHIQVWISPDMFLEAKLHSDGTYDLLMMNPKFTNPSLGKKISLKDLLNEKSKIKIKHEYIHKFLVAIQDMAVSLSKKSLK